MSEADIDVALFGMRKLGSDESGRDALFADPATGKFWELTYRQSHCTAADQPRQLSENFLIGGWCQIRERQGMGKANGVHKNRSASQHPFLLPGVRHSSFRLPAGH
jgi:hypothetical protein